MCPQKKQRKREREREREAKTLSLNTKKSKKVFCLRLFCVHTKNAPIDRTCGSKRLVTLCNTMTLSSFRPIFFFFCLSLSRQNPKKNNTFFKTLNDRDHTHRRKISKRERREEEEERIQKKERTVKTTTRDTT